MLKGFKYRIYPTKSQREFFEKEFGCCRFIYNWALNTKIEAYQKDKTSLSANDLCKMLTHLKKEEGMEWLKEPTNESLQQSIRNMDSAFTRFFREKKGFPKFKSKHKSKPTCKFINNVVFDFENSRIQIPKVGSVKFVKDREFKGKTGTLTVSKSLTGKYYASIVVETNNPIPNKPKIEEDSTMGIDVGLKTFAVCSDGTIYPNMKFLEKNHQRLKVLQRRLSRKQKGSNRRKIAKLKVAKQHERIKNLRENYLHHVTSRIITENQSIIIEDLNIEGMLKNHCLAKGISSVAWGEFFRMLKYKSEWYGRNLICIGRFEPSSKMCTCGEINSALELKDRHWTCQHCGTKHDRDFLAASNIKRFGLQNQNLIGQTPAVGGEGDVESLSLDKATKRQNITN